MKLVTATSNGRVGALRRPDAAIRRLQSAFTLMECIVALTFLAVIIPVAIEAFHIASGAGTIAARKGQAARVAQRVLNQSIVMTNWNSGSQGGTISEGATDFRWTMTSDTWQPNQTQPDPLKLLTANVTFSVQGRDYTVKLTTLAAPLAQTTIATTQ